MRGWIVGAVTLAVLGFGAPLHAEPRGAERANLDQLRMAKDEARWRAMNSKTVQKLEFRNEERRLDGLIDRLERGGQVDPDEIDEALR